MRRLLSACVLIAACLTGTTWGAEANPWPAIPRKLPPPGVEVPAKELAALERKAKSLAQAIEGARPKADAALLPDVEIYLRAVRLAIDQGEFFDVREPAKARQLLERGRARLESLAAGHPDWVDKRGTLVRGFRSRLDDSIQPYGLVIPASLSLNKKVPLYVWLHGRGDKTTEVGFILGRETKPGEMQPKNAIVVHPFGRYCNGFKFAGEIDVLEAIDAVKSHYPIDDDRIVLCGFSMGGAGAWHLGAHYADRWCAVSPGAGFAETAQYQKLTPEKYPPWYEQKLWELYDVPNYVLNLFNLPVIAYSGELDKQIQAARVMEQAFAANKHKLVHLIGPGMGHKYHPDVLAELQRRLAAAAEAGRSHTRDQITLETPTLRYDRFGPVRILGLYEHWLSGRVAADLTAPRITTSNVTALEIDWLPHNRSAGAGKLLIDGQEITRPSHGRQLLERSHGTWQSVAAYPSKPGLRKLHGLQGPIDDAFMEPFLVVTPSGRSRSAAVERWVQAELAHFLDRWRRLFRGMPRVKRDVDVTDEDMGRYHLIAWGDPDSNRLLARVAPQLPIRVGENVIELPGKDFARADHVLLMIYPNPLHPARYLVANSGPTFREGHDASNSLQTPKLPDWAIVDVRTPPDAFQPGRVAAADFFDEGWQLRPAGSRR